MSLVITLPLGLVLLLAPCLAALPDESLWSSWLCAGTWLVAMLAVIAARRTAHANWLRVSRSETAFLILLGLAFLSIPLRLILQHGTGYFGPMLRGWAIFGNKLCLVCPCAACGL